MDVPVAANVLGTIGAICWSVQLLPQILINYRRHHTTGLQPSMMLLWASAGIPLGVYNIVENVNIALRVQAQILTILSLITWSQCYYYSRGWKLQSCAVISGVMCLFMGSIEVGLTFALKMAIERHMRWPVTLMAILAAVLLAAGVLRHYWDIYRHRTVRGISFIFVGLDAAGDLFSLVSLFFQGEIKILGIAIYGTELALWTGVFVCGGFFNFTPWIKAVLLKRRQKKNTHGRGQTQMQGNELSSIPMHDTPSSTSVFRTPSMSLVDRSGGRTCDQSGECVSEGNNEKS